MCTFMSCNSDGKGNVQFFKPEDVVKEMAKGNPSNYEFNSHSSIASFYKCSTLREDRLNKWEYDPDKKELKADALNTDNDRDKVKKVMDDFFKNADVAYLRNLYNGNNGHWNSGHWNSGHGNSGDRNSGDRNTGHRNSGDRNSGDRNSGDRNSGHWNSGHRNSGDGNSATVMGHFCSKDKYFLFNKPCTKAEADKVKEIYIDLPLIKWVSTGEMTPDEKANYPSHAVTGGFLRVLDYKEAWKLVSKEKIDEIKKLKNFNKKVFKEITGLSV